MTVPRGTSPLLRSLSVAGAVAVTLVAGATTSHAAPDTGPSTSAQAAAQLRTVSAQLQQVNAQYAAAKKLLVKETAAAKAASVKAESTARAATGYEDQIKHLVQSQVKSAPVDQATAIFTSGSADDFLQQASLLQIMSSRRSAVLNAALAANKAATKAQTDATTAAAAAAKLTKDLAAKRTTLTQQTAQSKVLYDQLSTAEQQAFLSSAGDSTDRASRDSSRGAPPLGSVPASARAATAVATARAQIGKPYVWGATGPDSFDCSGLTSYAWRAAGVEIPRTSGAQYAAGTKVARANLQPGDLVYFGSPVYHVAIYIGSGMMITAPQPGEVVKYQAVDVFPDYTGATRPGV